MPYRDNERKLAYQREWYAKNRAKVVAKVKARKHSLYAGVCRNCGAATMGQSKGQSAEWCDKPDCASIQRQIVRQERREMGENPRWGHVLSLARRKGKWKGFCVCGWQSGSRDSVDSIQLAYKQHTNLVEREGKSAADGA